MLHLGAEISIAAAHIVRRMTPEIDLGFGQWVELALALTELPAMPERPAPKKERLSL